MAEHKPQKISELVVGRTISDMYILDDRATITFTDGSELEFYASIAWSAGELPNLDVNFYAGQAKPEASA